MEQTEADKATLVQFATDFTRSAQTKLQESGLKGGVFMLPYATEYRAQGTERKYHLFTLADDGTVIGYDTCWRPVHPGEFYNRPCSTTGQYRANPACAGCQPLETLCKA